MDATMLRDAERKPSAFRWNGQIPEGVLSSWMAQHALTVPPDLVDLWRATGGGELFEGEVILGPSGDAVQGEDVLATNRFHHDRGLSQEYLLFHVGAHAVTGVDYETSEVVVLDAATYRPLRRYDRLEDWYVKELRHQYASAYDLS